MYTHFKIYSVYFPTVEVDDADNCTSGWPYGPVGLNAFTAANFPPFLQGKQPFRTGNADMDDRLNHMLYALGRAYVSYNANIPANDANILKIVTFPEFFFRPPVSPAVNGGAYSAAEKITLGNALKTMMTAENLKNWLLVAGTILYNTPNPDSKGLPRFFIMNAAIVIEGGYTAKLHQFEKCATSGIDGVAPAQVPETSPQLAQAQTNKSAQRFILLGEKLMAIEICLEHYLGIAKKSAVDAGKNVNLHIITAGGMRIISGKVACKTGGYVHCIDGITYPAVDNMSVLKRKTSSLVNINEEAAVPLTDGLVLDSVNPPPSPGALPHQQIYVYPTRSF